MGRADSAPRPPSPPNPPPPGPPPAPGAKSVARARFRFRLPRPLGGGDEPAAARHHGAGSLACLCCRDPHGGRRPGLLPSRLPAAGRPEDAPPTLGLPTLRPLASPGPARRPRSFLPSARPSERRRPTGSLKQRRLPPPPPPRRSLPLSSLRRSLHVKPPEWSQGEVGNAATYGEASRPAGPETTSSVVAVRPSRQGLWTRGAGVGAGSASLSARGRPRSCQKA